jgi:hypothetical protein
VLFFRGGLAALGSGGPQVTEVATFMLDYRATRARRHRFVRVLQLHVDTWRVLPTAADCLLHTGAPFDGVNVVSALATIAAFGESADTEGKPDCHQNRGEKPWANDNLRLTGGTRRR